MSKQELLNYDSKKSMRKEIISFLAFSAFVMVPLTYLVVQQLAK